MNKQKIFIIIFVIALLIILIYSLYIIQEKKQKKKNINLPIAKAPILQENKIDTKQLNEDYQQKYLSIMKDFITNLQGIDEEKFFQEEEKWKNLAKKIKKEILDLRVSENYKKIHLKTVIFLSMLEDINKDNYNEIMDKVKELNDFIKKISS